MTAALISDILSRIEESREDLADLALLLGNTYGPLGNEEPTARAVHEWYRDNGMESHLVPMIEGRAGTVGLVRGAGDGKSLVFNAHLDTEASGPDFDLLMEAPDPNRVGARREGDRIFGHTVQNDRGCMAVQMIAGRALLEAGAPLRGDLLLKSAAGETGSAPVDEYQGLRYESKGFGTSWLLEHGYTTDYAVIAETTDFSVSWVQCGAAYYKITLRGRNMYTPRLQRPAELSDHPNAIVRAGALIGALENWAIEYERSRTIETPCGTMRPKSQIGAIRGGIPWRPNRSSTYAALYMDVRTRPGDDIAEITASLKEAIAATGLNAELRLIMFKPGYAATQSGIAPLTGAIADSHRFVRGREIPERAEAAVVSMWRDTNVYNKVGIPALTFGPSRGKAAVQGTGYMQLDNMLDGAKIYALTALSICAGISAQT
jgi:acetylornithine deacetylase/succinyl-diaminopimelate desuccinylase-like protein